MTSESRGSDLPSMAASDQTVAHNYRIVQADSAAMGLVNAAGPFLPVLLVRLGASGTQVGLLTALPGVSGVLLAIPIGRWLQRRRNIVSWYSRARLLAQSTYAGMALAVFVAPPGLAIDLVLVLWAASTIPNMLGQVAFPIVMDGAAGARGRYELLSRRWSIMGLVTAAAVVAAGQLLGIMSFPANYEVLFVGFSLAALASFWFSRQIRIPDQAPIARAGGPSLWVRSRELLGLVRSESSFVRYEFRAFFTSAGTGLAAPLLPLFYVHEVQAPDWWIGIIAAGQSAGALVGYQLARRVARRRGGGTVLLPALLGAALVPVTLALVHDLAVVAALSLVGGMASAAASLSLFDELMQRVPLRYGVTFSAIDQSTQNIALTAAPLASGVLAVTIGIRPALVVVTVVSALGFMLFAIDRRARAPVPGAEPL
jgi:hypothetical protein